MKAALAFAALICVALAPAAKAACRQGAYASDQGDYVVVVTPPNSQPPVQRYLFRDGRRGNVADDNAPVTCADDAVTIRKSDGSVERWKQVSLTVTDTHFPSVETQLAGR